MTTDPPSFAGSYRRIAVAALLCVGSALLAGGAHADPVDAGTPRAPSSSPDSGTGSGAGDAAAPAPAPVDPTAARITKLREQADALNRAAYDRPAPPKPLDRLFSVALNDPAAVSGAMKKLATDRDALVAQVDKWDAILVRLEADLNRSSALLEAQKKRQQRRRRYKIDPALVKAVTEGEALVAQTRQDRDLIDARLSLASARLGFLKRTQPERVRSQKQKAALERRLEQAKKAAEAEQLKAEAEQREAEAERQKALAAQKRARTEAERLVASERARLEDIRARLARHRQAQVTRRAALTREKAKLETFRGEISARADSLQAGWPGTAADYGKLHDRVVSKLRVLRPAAVKELTDRLSARVQVPTPGRRLDTRISDLDPIFQPQVKQLERLRAELVTIEATQAREDARLASERLAFIHKEITWLNQHRIHMLTKVSPEKRAALTGLTRETLDFIVVHQYFMAEFGNRLRLAEAVAQHRAYLREQIPDRHVQIALTEWNVNKRSKSRGIGSALVLAEAIGEYLRGGVDLACLWPMRYRGRDWGHRGLLNIETHAPTPNYYVMKLFSSQVGRRLVAATVSNAMVYAFASARNNQQTIFLINRSVEREGVTCQIETDAPRSTGASAIALTAPAVDSDQVNLAPAPVSPGPEGWTCKLPPHSLTVLSLRR